MRFFFLCYVFLFVSSFQKMTINDDDYFYKITEELIPIIHKTDKILIIQRRELDQFKKTGGDKYLISSKYIDMFLHKEDPSKQIEIAYDLLRINRGRYDFISMACNFNLAITLENISPKLAMQFVSAAIKYDEKLEGKYYLGHLYHIKGRIYYNEKAYASAMHNFNKALLSFRNDHQHNNTIYIASMYNNFGLTYSKLNKIKEAHKETERGISILQNKGNLSREEIDFLHIMKGNSGFYLYKLKNYPAAEKLLLEEFEYYKNKESFCSESIVSSQRLFDLYLATHQKEKQNQIIDYLIKTEPKLKNTHSRIVANEVIQEYYVSTNNYTPLKAVSEKLIGLNHSYYDENKRNVKKISDLLNNQIIRNNKEKDDYKAYQQKRKNLLFIIFILIVFGVFGIILYNIKKHNKREKELLKNNGKILEQNNEFQKEKIKNLLQSLNLKIDTEKAFLEYLKKNKKINGDNDSEQILKELFLKVNNLIQIDRRSYDLIIEGNIENKLFLEKLSVLCPTLTNTELKFCTYYRMNLSSKEISSLENTTNGTIRVYKTKIKSKLKLNKEDDLSCFLNNI
ncbi:hypothetical protein PMI13_02875 [Chryseobacterium populi]|uniref:Uncharacterized protein n=2 Tax=Chryseobacterium populi TaxID=1144316 RepID=J2SX15_9FLAO|nr:hypothetical protein PMI13_02875 [Chryseobacterium populi]